MRKVLPFLIVLLYIFLPNVAFGQTPTVKLTPTPTSANTLEKIQVAPPENQGIDPDTSISEILTNIFRIIFVVAALAVLFMMIWGAFEWITSGGDKEKVAKARERITNALIGLALLALAFFILRIVGQMININLFGQFELPRLGPPQGTR